MGSQPRRLGLRGDRVDRGARGLLVGGAAPVKGDDRALVLESHAAPAQVGGIGLPGELVDPLRPIEDPGIDDRFGPPGAQHLGAVRAEV